MMTSSGVALMGMAEAEGEDRAMRAVQEAINSPLLNDNDIKGAKYVLLNIALGTQSISMDEMSSITDHIQDASGSTADVIWGYCTDESLGNKIRVTVIATGFNQNELSATLERRPEEKKVQPLDSDLPTTITAPITGPISNPLQGALSLGKPAEPGTFEMYVKPVEATKQQSVLPFDHEPVLPVQPKVEPVPHTQEEKIVFDLGEDHGTETVPPSAANQPAVTDPAPMALSPLEHQARVENRLAKLREASLRLRTPNGLAEMEREPAFKRKNVMLEDSPHSTDSNVSRFTLTETTSETGERQVGLRRNNPFLHDNVD